MLKYYYKWRYNRAQRDKSFKLPSSGGKDGNSRVSLGSYLSQTSVRGRTFDRFDLPNKRRRGLQLLCAVALIAGFCWLVYESLNAIAMLSR
ncbi:MAG TPA: hypothetical protein DCX06_05535 [Opitutae bacterium]|nr:hypothetical protein [Opitutae bacterium]